MNQWKRKATSPKIIPKENPKMNSQNILIREEIYTIRERLGLYMEYIIYTITCIYIYICVCVCVCVFKLHDYTIIISYYACYKTNLNMYK